MKFYTLLIFSYVFFSIWSECEAFHLLKSYVERRFKENDGEKSHINFKRAAGSGSGLENSLGSDFHIFLERYRRLGLNSEVNSERGKMKNVSKGVVSRVLKKNYSQGRIKMRNVFGNFFPLGKPNIKCTQTTLESVGNYLFNCGSEKEIIINPPTRRFQMVMCPLTEEEYNTVKTTKKTTKQNCMSSTILSTPSMHVIVQKVTSKKPILKVTSSRPIKTTQELKITKKATTQYSTPVITGSTQEYKNHVFQHIDQHLSKPKREDKYMYLVPSKDFLIRYNISSSGIKITADHLKFSSNSMEKRPVGNYEPKANTTTFILSVKDIFNEKYRLPLKYLIPIKKYVMSLNLTRSEANLTMNRNQNVNMSSFTTFDPGSNVILKVINDKKEYTNPLLDSTNIIDILNKKIRAENTHNCERKVPRSIFKKMRSICVTKKAPPWSLFCPEALKTKSTCVPQAPELRNQRPWAYTCCFKTETCNIMKTAGSTGRSSSTTTPVCLETTSCSMTTPVCLETTSCSMTTPVCLETTSCSMTTPVSLETTSCSMTTPVSLETTSCSMTTPVCLEITSSSKNTPSTCEEFHSVLKTTHSEYKTLKEKKPSKNTMGTLKPPYVLVGSNNNGSVNYIVPLELFLDTYNKNQETRITSTIKGRTKSARFAITKKMAIEKNTYRPTLPGGWKKLFHLGKQDKLLEVSTRMEFINGTELLELLQKLSSSVSLQESTLKLSTTEKSGNKKRVTQKINEKKPSNRNKGFWSHFGPQRTTKVANFVWSFSRLNSIPKETVGFTAIIPATALPATLKVNESATEGLKLSGSSTKSETGKTTDKLKTSMNMKNIKTSNKATEATLLVAVKQKINNSTSNRPSGKDVELINSIESSITKSLLNSGTALPTVNSTSRFVRSVDKYNSTIRPRSIFNQIFAGSKKCTSFKKQRERKPWETPWGRRYTQAISNQPPMYSTFPTMSMSKHLAAEPDRCVNAVICNKLPSPEIFYKSSISPEVQNNYQLAYYPRKPVLFGPSTQYYIDNVSPKSYYGRQNYTTHHLENMKSWTPFHFENAQIPLQKPEFEKVPSVLSNRSFELVLDSPKFDTTVDESEEDYVTYLLKFPKSNGIISKSANKESDSVPQTIKLTEKKPKVSQFNMDVPKFLENLFKEYVLEKDLLYTTESNEFLLKTDPSKIDINVYANENSGNINKLKYSNAVPMPLHKSKPILLLLQPFLIDNHKVYLPIVQEKFEEPALLNKLISNVNGKLDLSSKSLNTHISKPTNNKLPISLLSPYSPIEESTNYYQLENKNPGKKYLPFENLNYPNWSPIFEETTNSDKKLKDDIISEVLRISKIAGLKNISLLETTTLDQFDLNVFNYESVLESTSNPFLGNDLDYTKYVFMDFKPTSFIKNNMRDNIILDDSPWTKSKLLPLASYNICYENPGAVSDDFANLPQQFVKKLKKTYEAND